MEQVFLTPHWLEVEGFGLAKNPDGSTDFSSTLPPAPQPFFTEEFAGSVLNFDAQTITLGSDLTLGTDTFLAGDTIGVSKDLIGPVINQGFITQAEEGSLLLLDEETQELNLRAQKGLGDRYARDFRIRIDDSLAGENCRVELLG